MLPDSVSDEISLILSFLDTITIVRQSKSPITLRPKTNSTSKHVYHVKGYLYIL